MSKTVKKIDITLKKFLNLTEDERAAMPDDFSFEITLDEFIALSDEDKAKLPVSVFAFLSVRKKQKDDQDEAAQIKIKYKDKASRGVFLIEVEDARAWIRNVDRKDISMVAAMAGEDPIYSAELLLDALWLEGDERLKNDDDYFLGTINTLKGLIKVKGGNLKKF